LLSPEEGPKVASVLQSKRFTKKERLKKNTEFEKVFRKGRKVSGRYVALHYRFTGEDHKRLGVTVSKRVDRRAVTRNRLKRNFREIFRTNRNVFPDGADIVLRAMPGSADAKYGELKNEILSLAELIGPKKASNSADQIL